MEWLKHHVEPLTKVKEFMSKTSVKRASWIREHSDLSVGAILKEHPRLIDTPGMVSTSLALCDSLLTKFLTVTKLANKTSTFYNFLNSLCRQLRSITQCKCFESSLNMRNRSCVCL